MSYPTTIDSIPEPTATSATNNPSASGVSVAQTTAIVALETKLGTGASTPIAGDVLTSTSNGTSVWAAPTAGNVSNTGTPTSGQIAQWTGATVIQGLATTGSGNVVLSTSPTLVTPALGTPASGVATNLTGTASGLTAGNVTTNANLTGPITSSGNATAISNNTVTPNQLSLSPQTSYVATDESTTSTTYSNLTTSQAVTVTVGADGIVQVVFSAGIYNGPASQRLSVAVSGANTIAANDNWSIRCDDATFIGTQTMVYYFTGLTAGSTTFTLQSKTPSGTMHYFERRLTAMAL